LSDTSRRVGARAGALAGRVVAALLGLALFVIALQLLKSGASAAEPVLRALGVSGFAGGVGAGWLGACLLLSGSPVAAIGLSLLAAGALTTVEAFGLVSGSRLGASFVVLAVGVLDDLRAGRQAGRSAYVGVAALVATAAVYLPAMALAALALERGLLADLLIEPRSFEVGVDGLSPLLALAARLPSAVAFVAGVGVLLLAFRAFDRALPDPHRAERPLLPADHVVYRPWFMFVIGLAATALTLSVSVSLSLLVPLTSRGHVRRENVWPYILGANVTTLVDTLFAGALVGHPDAPRLVALLMLAVAVVSLPLVFVFPGPFGRAVDGFARRATASARAAALFAALLFGLPLALIVLF
jgi:hypothetical protein